MMFTKTQNRQADLFTSTGTNLGDRKLKDLVDPQAEHNIFYREVVSRIDEGVFRALYSDGMGRTNAPIRILVGMIILKNGNDWTDKQLFKSCRYDILTMRSLGIINLDDEPPVPSTYYKFQNRVQEFNALTGRDLYKEAFSQVTLEQLEAYNISGAKIRLDSKLINSNVANHTRLELILEFVRQFVLNLDEKELQGKVGSTSLKIIDNLKKHSVPNITYHLTPQEKNELLEQLGYSIAELLEIYNDRGVKNYEKLALLYSEQYEENSESDEQDNTGVKIELKSRKALSSGTLQSAHDMEATHRSKGNGKDKKQVKGFHANITETCAEENEINLIVDTNVVEANVSEAEFLEPSVKACEQMLACLPDKNKDNSVVEVITDGGYDSIENRKAFKDRPGITWMLCKMKGGNRVYRMSRNKDGELTIYHTERKVYCKVRKTRTSKIEIKTPCGSKRYMTEEEIENYMLAQELEEELKERITQQVRNLRANVESAIHQMFHTLGKNDKMAYRGKMRCHRYVHSRAFWVNFKRISKKIQEKAQKIVVFGMRRLIVHVIAAKQHCLGLSYR